jgi:hypothetical protein
VPRLYGRTLALAFFSFAWGLANFGLVTWLPTLLERLGYSGTLSSAYLSLSALIALPALGITTVLLTRWSTAFALALAFLLLAQLPLARRDVGNRDHERNRKDVRPDRRPEADVGHPGDRARDVDPDLGTGSGEPDEGPSRRGGEAPLPAELLERVRQVLRAPVGGPHGRHEDEGPDPGAHASSSGCHPEATITDKLSSTNGWGRSIRNSDARCSSSCARA